MRLKDVLVDSLKPYQSQLSSWKKGELEILFLGFGNLTVITPAGNEFGGTFYQNAVDICVALEELGFGELDFSARDFFYLIHAQPAKIRNDLYNCIINTGNKIMAAEGIDLEILDFEGGIDFEGEEE